MLLATGAEDVAPPIPDLDQAIRRGLIRHCPTCDAYEVRNRRVAIIDEGTCRWREALLLHSHTADLTILSLHRPLEMPEEQRATLREADVQVIDEPVLDIAIEGETVSVRLASGSLRFDTLYTALGLQGRSALARQCGARHDQDGMLIVDKRQHTSIPELYAVGDVVRGLTQIGVAMGQAAIAARVSSDSAIWASQASRRSSSSASSTTTASGRRSNRSSSRA